MKCLLQRATLALMLVVIGCHDETREDEQGRAPAILPRLMRTQTSNADASPPPVPYLSTTPRWIARSRAAWPHDTAAYTQGLLINLSPVLIDGPHLLESTGREGHSELRDVDVGTGRVITRTALPATAFGEGIALSGDFVYQLTWKGGRGYTYDQVTLARADSFTYDGEGWGLAAVDSTLYMSDGSADLRVIRAPGFRELRRVHVTEGGKPVWMLNELEVVGDELWANVYETNLIARIHRATGAVVGWIDVGSLLTQSEREDVERRGGVANGIAYDPTKGLVYVTGKLWPRIFALDLRDVKGYQGSGIRN